MSLADDQACVAAAAANVEISRCATLESAHEVGSLFASLWGPTAPAVPLLRALDRFGAVVLVARRGPRIIGALSGFYGRLDGEWALHSDMLAVDPMTQGAGVGRALKLAQRAAVLTDGAMFVNWTFDPLLARNAWFNLQVLGASAVEFEPNFYGPRDDDQNRGDRTDRLVSRWELTGERAIAAARGDRRPTARESTWALRDRDGEPVAAATTDDVVLVAVPPDIRTLRETCPALASRWRAAVRESLQHVLANGYAIDGFLRSGAYVCVRTHTPDLGQRESPCVS